MAEDVQEEGILPRNQPGSKRKMLLMFLDETDRWKDGSLFEAVVLALERHGIAGATALQGTIGYGVHRRVHRKGLFGVTDEKPVLVMAIDEEAKIRAVLPVVVPMVKEGLVALQDIEVISETKGRA